MRPIVNLYKLGRMSFNRALSVQRILFNELSINLLTETKPPIGRADGDLFGAVLQGCEPRTVVDKKLHMSKKHQNNNKENRNHGENQLEQLVARNMHFNDVESSGIQNLNPQFDIRKKTRNSLILVEHEPTYTIGIRRKLYDNDYVVKLMNQLEEHNIQAEFIETNRGGLVTFHGPGQLVAYPIIYLGDFPTSINNRSLRFYVALLEKTIIDTLRELGIGDAHTVREYPGVWVANGERKIAFIGVSCKRHITMHGISINCNCNLSWFDHIVSCGIEDKIITSIHQEYAIRGLQLPKTSGNDGQLSHDKSKDDTTNPQLVTSKLISNQVEDSNVLSNCSIDHVSEKFCHSFTQNFKCVLQETNIDGNLQQVSS